MKEKLFECLFSQAAHKSNDNNAAFFNGGIF